MFETTSDKVLRALIDYDNVFDISEKLSLVKKSLPNLSTEQIHSASFALHKDNFIIADIRNGEIFDVAVQPFALSKLTDKRDFKIFNFKFDLLKIFFGYLLGFISAWLLK